MPATDKPILTKAEVREWLRDFSQPSESTMQERGFHTVEAFAESLVHVLICVGDFCETCTEARRLLAAYHSTTAAINENKGDV